VDGSFLRIDWQQPGVGIDSRIGEGRELWITLEWAGYRPSGLLKDASESRKIKKPARKTRTARDDSPLGSIKRKKPKKGMAIASRGGETNSGEGLQDWRIRGQA